MDFFRTGYTARDVVFDAFRRYCKDLPADVSEVVLERERIMREAGVSEEDIARQEASFCTAVFPNTTPTLYWAIYELFSRPDVLEEVRQEISGHAVRKSEDGLVLDVAALKTDCLLLLSVLQETQRTRSINALVRKVMDDTLLDGRYLLKKGNFLQMPSQPIHINSALWGGSAETFDPRRFVSKKQSPTDDGKGSTGNVSSNFMPWGAAPHLCPARQFASTEILIVLALLAMRVELRPVTIGGGWEKDPATMPGDLVTVLNPVKDVQLDVGVRDEGVGRWSFAMGESRTKVPIASG